MPEYLSPGVFVEEVPGKLKALEGVSTSTAAFCGPAERGTVAGKAPPVSSGAGFTVSPDTAPVFVTSFAEFTRRFGAPLPLITQPADFDYGYLAYSVKAFFDNGGKRCYITRVVDGTATYGTTATALGQGVVYHLARSVTGGNTVYLKSLRDLDTTVTLELRRRSDASVITARTVTSYATSSGAVVLGGAALPTLDANEVYAVVTLPASTAPSGSDGPRFYGRSPGSWSESVRVQIVPADRTAVRLTAAAASGTSVIEVENATSFYAGAVLEIDSGGTGRTQHELTIVDGKKLTFTPALAANVPLANSFARVLELDVFVTDASGSAPPEVYRGMSWNQGPAADLRRHYAQIINDRSRLVWVAPPLAANETATVADQPMVGNGFAIALQPGVDGLPAQGGGGDAVYIGTDGGPGLRTGIESFKDLLDVRLIAAPGKTSNAVQLALITQCELLRYRFAILDVDPTKQDVMDVLGHRNLYDTSFAGYYAPWLGVTLGGQTRWLPPSGFMAGICARVDNQRGVWKAPANETPFNVVDLRTRYTTGEQEVLNPRGVNLIRRFDEGGIKVWGARTLSSDPEVKYINVRRTLIFLEATIDKNTQWVVFEPNSRPTWERVASSLRAFLETQWREGALFGDSPAQAFFVRCDESTMTEDDIQNGRLICQIGVAIVRPAEFVIFRIEQITGFATS